VEPLSRSLLAVGVTASFLALVFEGRDLDPARLVAAVACAIATLACSVLFLVSHPGRSRFVLRASALLLAGLAGFAAATLSNSGPVQALGPVILASALAAALLSLVPLVPGGNSRVMIGVRKMTTDTSNVVALCTIIFLVVSYVTVVRPLVGSEFPRALSVVEWSMVVVAVAIVAWGAYRYIKSISGGLALDGWKVLGNEVKRDKGELGPASEAVSEFIEGGRKESLILLVASVLEKNSVDAEISKSIISRIVEYQEVPPRLSTIRASRRREARLVEERRAVVREVLDLCDAATTAPCAKAQVNSISSFESERGGSGVGDQ
jgi:hypothetical protein